LSDLGQPRRRLGAAGLVPHPSIGWPVRGQVHRRRGGLQPRRRGKQRQQQPRDAGASVRPSVCPSVGAIRGVEAQRRALRLRQASTRSKVGQSGTCQTDIHWVGQSGTCQLGASQQHRVEHSTIRVFTGSQLGSKAGPDSCTVARGFRAWVSGAVHAGESCDQMRPVSQGLGMPAKAATKCRLGLRDQACRRKLQRNAAWACHAQPGPKLSLD
jgi:hypothetical protein